MNANEILINVFSIVLGSVFFVIFRKRVKSWRLTSPKKTLAGANAKLPSPRLKRIQDCGHVLSIASLMAAVLGALGTLLLIFILIHDGTILNLPQHRLLEDAVMIAFVLTITLVAWFCHKLFQQYALGNLFTKQVVYYLYKIGCLYVLVALEKQYLEQHFQFLTTSYPLLQMFPGLFIIFISWVMDEGRKIQEEQELTV
jgi:hypothetical protein